MSASHAVSPLLRLVPRGDTTVVDAYLSPILRRYVDQVAAELAGVKLYFMQSNGGLAEAAAFGGKDAILSGPAGGIVGAARTAAAAGIDRIIGFDMGGTSTDVALYDGAFERAFETEVAGVRMRAPMMAINTVAAGGGSILHFDGARFRVGPDSAGANPGPACYRRGGPLTVTDANVMRRQDPAARISRRSSAPVATSRWMPTWCAEVRRAGAGAGRPGAAAEGFLRIAVANMANAIKQVSLQKGHDAARFALQCFGGAGGQHACLVADELGMETVFIHPYAGVLSAYGMGLADQAVLREQAVEAPLAHGRAGRPGRPPGGRGRRGAGGPGRRPGRIGTSRGGASALRRHGGGAAGPARRRRASGRLHRRAPRPVRLRHAGARAGGGGGRGRGGRRRARRWRSRPCRRGTGGAPEPVDTVSIWTGGPAHDAPVFERTALLAGDRVTGPALMREANATTVVEPGWTAEVTARDHLLLRRTSRATAAGRGRRHAAGRTRCCWSCSTTCS